MKLSKLINEYRLRKKDLINYIKKNGVESIVFYISFSSIHSVVAYYWIMEEFDEYYDFAKSNMKRLASFYNITIDVFLMENDE